MRVLLAEEVPDMSQNTLAIHISRLPTTLVLPLQCSKCLPSVFLNFPMFAIIEIFVDLHKLQTFLEHRNIFRVQYRMDVSTYA